MSHELYEIRFGEDGRALAAVLYSVGQPPIASQGLRYVTNDPDLIRADLASLVASIDNGQVVGVSVDPDYVPSASVPDPVPARLEALEAAVERIPLNTPHNRRWLAQKERVKAAGIAYIKANPGCAQAELEQALAAELAAGFPGEPLVVNPAGLVQSYAQAAWAQGFIAEAGFIALRDLVAASGASDLQAMLQSL